MFVSINPAPAASKTMVAGSGTGAAGAGEDGEGSEEDCGEANAAYASAAAYETDADDDSFFAAMEPAGGSDCAPSFLHPDNANVTARTRKSLIIFILTIKQLFCYVRKSATGLFIDFIPDRIKNRKPSAPSLRANGQDVSLYAGSFPSAARFPQPQRPRLSAA